MLTSECELTRARQSRGGNAAELFGQIAQLDAFFREHAAANEALGRLVPEVIGALADRKINLMLVPTELGGLEFSPTETMRIIEQISWSDPSTGWVSMVLVAGTSMAAGFLSDAGAAQLFADPEKSMICGSGAPTGRAIKVEGGYKVSGRWSYGSGIQHAHWHHSGAMLFTDGKPHIDASGIPTMMIIHAPTDSLDFEGNWDTLGLKATGSIDYAERGVFVPDDLVFLLKEATPKRNQSLYGIGAIGLTSIGHSAWAAGAGRRILDEIAQFAREKKAPAMKTSTASLADSESFWEGYGKAEGRVRSARAFLYETWDMVEERIAANEPLSTRDMTLVRLSLNSVTTAAAEAADFAYMAAAGVSLRSGVLQRLFRDIYTGKQHITVSPGVLRNCGRELAGLGEGKVWALYELADPLK